MARAARKVSANELRSQLGQILDRTQGNGERFVVDRRGEPAAVIMGVDDYLANIAPEDAQLRDFRAAAKRAGLDRLTPEEIDAEIAASRRDRRVG